MTLTEIRDRLRPLHSATRVTRCLSEEAPLAGGAPTAGDVTAEKAFVVHGNTRTLITGPASTWEKASLNNRGFVYLQGRYVEADKPNRNGAYWSTGDLELGQPTVAGGPLNWLHEEKTVIGALMDSKLVYAREQAAEQTGTHIQALAAVWRFLHPEKASALVKHAADKQLWLSMECVSDTVQCITGCGQSFPYKDWTHARARVCAHLQAGAPRRFVDPVFLGSAVIVPPVRPGWANADAEVLREAASLTETNELGDGPLSREEAEHMVTAILQWANTE